DTPPPPSSAGARPPPPAPPPPPPGGGPRGGPTTATATASRLLGAAGQTEDHPLARLHAAARVHEVIEGPTEVLQDIIAADLLRGRRSTTDPAPSPAAPYRKEDDHRAQH
ncbi:acyl-CoA dehydrogenase family protein, partial [Streptomyces vinaceus]|uniref:acyl-CoA dehydrogenase family protein n=1 Tax=Streptomyces vinaceus TaxID=1960 RepID=UPI00369CC7C6